LVSLPSQAQSEKGVPFLKNFSPAEYGHKGKIWDIDNAENGILYMAADEGLLEYDGLQWKNFKGSAGITRSVYVASDSVIYTGSDLDFGVWKKNIYKDFTYTSLYPFKEELNDINEEFWSVHELNGNILFVSASNIYAYNEQGLTKIPAPNKIQKSFFVDQNLYFIDEQEGLYTLQNLAPKLLFRFDEVSNPVPEITGMYKSDDGLVLVSQNRGLFRYSSNSIVPSDNELTEKLKRANVFSFEQLNDGKLAFGTILDGLLISDKDGNIIHDINKSKGLQNNTILSLHFTQSGKLWLGMDYGVSFLDLNNEYSFFYDYRGEFGTAHSAVLLGDTFFLGTNQGLYRTKWEDLNNNKALFDFEVLPGTEGQVWTLDVIDNQLWIGHDRGLFKLEAGRIKTLHTQHGYWTLIPFGEYLLGGTYNGISIFEKKGNEWTYLKQMELILGSCNQLVFQKENILWVNIPNFGVIKANLDENLYPQERQIFLSEEFGEGGHYLEKEGAAIKVKTESSEFSYNEAQNEFVKQPQEPDYPNLVDVVKGNAQPIRLNGNFEFLPLYNGFALKNLAFESFDDTVNHKLVFRHLESFNNEEIVEIYDGSEVSYSHNNIRIESTVPNQENVLYQFRTEQMESWTGWSPDNTFELIGLGQGEYTVQARAKLGDMVTPVANLGFRINSPWYLSWYAILFYVGIFIFTGYLVYIWQKTSLNRQKKSLLINQRYSLQEMSKRHKRKLKIVEEQKLKAEYDKVKAQLKSKTIELATKAKENDEKNRILKQLREKLEMIEENPEVLKHRAGEIKRIIDTHIDSDDNTFEIQIDELHQEFFDLLRKDYPDLTRYDLRLCAYIKLGFDSKEIADLLNIKPSSIYISRSRLRKKLDIGSDEDLHGFLNSL